jgi:hypothetical protein
MINGYLLLCNTTFATQSSRFLLKKTQAKQNKQILMSSFLLNQNTKCAKEMLIGIVFDGFHPTRMIISKGL